MCKAILRFLSDLPEITVIGEAATLPEAVSKTSKLYPDVVVLDLNIPKVLRLSTAYANARVVATSLRIDDESKTLAEIIGAAKLLDFSRCYAPCGIRKRLSTAAFHFR